MNCVRFRFIFSLDEANSCTSRYQWCNDTAVYSGGWITNRFIFCCKYWHKLGSILISDLYLNLCPSVLITPVIWWALVCQVGRTWSSIQADSLTFVPMYMTMCHRERMLIARVQSHGSHKVFQTAMLSKSLSQRRYHDLSCQGQQSTPIYRQATDPRVCLQGHWVCIVSCVSVILTPIGQSEYRQTVCRLPLFCRQYCGDGCGLCQWLCLVCWRVSLAKSDEWVLE